MFSTAEDVPFPVYGNYMYNEIYATCTCILQPYSIILLIFTINNNFLSFFFLLDQWSAEFIKFLLDNIEDPPESDLDDELPDAFLNMILSFNQHFECKN